MKYTDKIETKKVTFLGGRRIDVILETTNKDFFVGNILKCTICDKVTFFRIFEISNTSKKVNGLNLILEIKVQWYGRYNKLLQNYKTMKQLLECHNWEAATDEEAREIKREVDFL